MKYLLNRISFISLMVLFSFFDNFGMEIEKDYYYLFKVVFVGDAGVGKTQIMTKFVKNEFSNDYEPTWSANYMNKNIKYNGENIRLQPWDLSGQENFFKKNIKNYLKDVPFIALVYAIDNKNSFINIKNWVDIIKDNTNKNPKFLLVGNKCDLEGDKRRVTKEEAKKYAEENKMEFFEVSAKTGKGIDVMFEYIISELLKDMEKEEKEKIQVKNLNKDVELNHNNNDLSCWNKYCSCCPCL